MSKKSEKNQFIFNLSSSKFNIIPLREITFKTSLTISPIATTILKKY